MAAVDPSNVQPPTFSRGEATDVHLLRRRSSSMRHPAIGVDKDLRSEKERREGEREKRTRARRVRWRRMRMLQKLRTRSV